MTTEISNWFALDSTYRLVVGLANRLGISPNPWISTDSVKARVSAPYPSLITVKRGSPKFGGGTWIHHKLAVHLAMWCCQCDKYYHSTWDWCFYRWLPSA